MSAGLVEGLSEGTGGRKPEMAGSAQGKCNGVGGVHSRSWPLPKTMNLEQVNSSNPMGPRA